MKDPPKLEGDLIKTALGSIEKFRPYRDEFIETCKFLGRYLPDSSYADRIHGLSAAGPHLEIRPSRAS